MGIVRNLRRYCQEQWTLIVLYACALSAAACSLAEMLRPLLHVLLLVSPIAIGVSAILLSYRLTFRTLSAIGAVITLCFLAAAGGVNLGFPFGDYVYTSALGPKVLDVPIVVPFIWLAVLIPAWIASEKILRYKHVVVASIVVTAFDAVLEPAASSLDLWHWKEGMPTEFNYISWFLVSAASFSLLTSYADEKAPHGIVSHLLIAQLLFYLAADVGIRLNS